jgi:hypothetical protein
VLRLHVRALRGVSVSTRKLHSLAVRTPNNTPEERAHGALGAGAKWISRDIVVALLRELSDTRMRLAETEEALGARIEQAVFNGRGGLS